ncbi:DUF3696 domain-containing protein [Vibrio cholerae]|uniref:DUF3696 domain-containing protein n=1 Tax=Vibrio cholerae TaxID=666 RepID=UPI0011D66171|nr:DUF3696 domain-containing protein [Vibrio cholerae]TYA08286.1 DUF3696 domain-containing protein [Vibrio cholerae]
MTISNIKLMNFKSFESLDIKLTNLNVFAGTNSVGKSTIIQALLLIKQNEQVLLNSFNPDDKNVQNILRFNTYGSMLDIGDDNSLLYIDAGNDKLSVSIEDHEGIISTISKDTNEKFWKLDISDLNTLPFSSLLSENPSQNSFRYLSTNREKPRVIYPLSHYDVENNSLGDQGQFTTHYLAENKSRSLNNLALKHPNSQTPYLLENVSNWLSEVSENIDVSAKVIPEANQAALTFSYAYGSSKTRELTPLNVGFGVTHVLPVITMLLMADVGDTIVIENPETHLHPKGQANLAKLIALVAEQGVQIIIETHSDHIINGLRVATKQKIIKPTNSKVYFFKKKHDSITTIAQEIFIQQDGSLSSWPKGFFDEWDNQLDLLIW